jgi:hypothetical protein
MSAPTKRPRTLNLNLGGKIFPVKQTVLFEKCGLFRDDPSLLGASEYEVQTQVSPPIFSAFVQSLESRRIEVSSTTVQSFRLLAKEFDFKRLLRECAGFSFLHRGFCGSSSGVEGESKPAMPCVTITAEGCCHPYRVAVFSDEIERFGMRLTNADENGIEIEGIEEDEDIVEKAIETVYSNTVASFPEGDARKSFSVMFLSIMSLQMSLFDIDSRRYCLKLRRAIAPTSVDVARHLLLSQCDPNRPNEYVPLHKPDWGVVAMAIRILQSEKNGRTNERMTLLRILKAQPEYEAFLGKLEE